MEEYNKYFKIPDFYTEITTEIHSENLLPLFKANPIQYMRKLYINDNEHFYNVRDELILRGIGFQLNYQNNYLLDRQYNIKYIISKENNTNAFKNISFSLIGANNFTERFNIKSDRFFHGVPLEGVLYFTRGISIEALQNMFETAGFSIISFENFTFSEKNEVEEKFIDYKTRRDLSTLVNPSPNDTSIDYLFEGTIYKTFRDYCKKNNVKYFHQLNIDFVKSFGYQKDVRENTAKKVFSLYLDINKQFFNINIRMQEAISLLLDNSFKRLMENSNLNYKEFLEEFYSANSEEANNTYPFEKVKEIERYIINLKFEEETKLKKEKFSKLISEIKEHSSFIYIEDLSFNQIENMLCLPVKFVEDKSMLLIECFEDIKYMEALKNLYSQLSNIKSLSESFERILEHLSVRDLKVLHLRQSKTLEEIGQMIGVTRERVRQIQKKATDKLSNYKSELNLKLYIYYYSKENNKLLSTNDFMEFYNLEGDMYRMLLNLFFEMEDEVTYVSKLGLYIEEEKYKYIKGVLEEIGLERPIIKLAEIKQYFVLKTEDLYLKITELLLLANKYKRVDDIYVKVTISIIARVNYLFENVITEPLNMDEEGYLYFKKLMNSTFDIPYNSNKRAATTRVSDGDNVILVDRNTFALHKQEAITDDFLHEIEKIINDHLKNNNYADPRIIYKQHGTLMKQAQLISPSHLYSIVQIYLDEKFETADGNTLYIYNVNSEKLNDETILLNYLNKNGHEVNKNIVLKDLKWKHHKLDGLLGRTQKILLIKENKLKTVDSFGFKKEELNMLALEVEKNMKNGYIFIQDLKFELGFNPDFSLFIERHDLLNDSTLIAILKWLLPNLQGHSKLLYWKGNSITKLEEVITHEYPDILTRQNLISFIEDKGYSTQTFDQIASRIFEENLFYYYTTTQYINSKQLHFTEEVKMSLATYLTNEFENKNYMSVYNMAGFTNKILPISEHQWTEWLIYQFAKYLDYEQVSFTEDSRHERLVLVRKIINVDKFDKLVLYVIKTEYGERRYHEEDLARYLEARSLINNPRKLPNIIRESRYFEFDSFGFFKLRCDIDVVT